MLPATLGASSLRKGLGHNPVLLYPCNSLNPWRGATHSATFPSFPLPKSCPLRSRRRHSLLNSDSCHGDGPALLRGQFLFCVEEEFVFHKAHTSCSQSSGSYLLTKSKLQIKAVLSLGQVNPSKAFQFLTLSLSLHNIIQARTEQEHAFLFF